MALPSKKTLLYPSKCSTASARWSMMSMDWGAQSQVPHWMHFEAGPSAAAKVEALDELVVFGSALQVQQVHGDGDLHPSGQSLRSSRSSCTG